MSLVFAIATHSLQWRFICFSFANNELVGFRFVITTVEAGYCERALRMINQDQLLSFG